MHVKSLKSISVVVSIYNEEDSLPFFWESLYSVIIGLKDISFEVIFINDGSNDNSCRIINEIINSKTFSSVEFISLEFSKNFGHESAMIAGIDIASKEAIVCLDADLQHPPVKINEMISKFNEGFEIVTLIRQKRLDNGVVKRTLSLMFYNLLNKISDYSFDKNASDFFLISNKIALVLKENFRERNRFLRGYIQTIGFSKTSIYYEAPSRVGGGSSYSFLNLIKLSFTAIFSFSNKPLRISLVISLVFALFTIAISVYSLWVYFFGKTPPSGYTTVIVFQSVCFTILFLLVGILSLYFANALSEIRRRPIYLVERLVKKNVKEIDEKK